MIWLGNLRESGHLGNQDLDGKIILKYILKKLFETWDGIDLSQDRDTYFALENGVMKLISIKYREFPF